MVPGDFEIVTILVILFFAIPILVNINKTKLLKAFDFLALIKVLNKSLIYQGIIAVSMIPISWICNKFDFMFGDEFAGSTYTYIIIGIFMYLPALGVLNLIKLLIQGKRENQKIE